MTTKTPNRLEATVFVYRHGVTGGIRAEYLDTANQIEDTKEWSHIATLEPRLWIQAHYTDPAPMSKEDMVKVLEALNNLLYFPNIKDNKKFCDVRNDAVKATTILQSAIEGMK